MYSRQNRTGQGDVSVELPRDYSGSAFSPFRRQSEPPLRNTGLQTTPEPKTDSREECHKREEEPECREHENDDCDCSGTFAPEPLECPSQPPRFNGLSGLKGLFGGNIGLEELLLLGVIFLIFTDNDLRDNELLICLLLILFI